MKRLKPLIWLVVLSASAWALSEQVLQDEQDRFERNRERWEQLGEAERQELRRRYTELRRLEDEERQRLEKRERYLQDLRERVFEQLDRAEQNRLNRLPFPERARLWRQILEPKLAEIEEDVSQWIPGEQLETWRRLPEPDRLARLEGFLVEEIRRTVEAMRPERPLPPIEEWRRNPDPHLRGFLEDRKRELLEDPPSFYRTELTDTERQRLENAPAERFFHYLRRRFPEELRADFPPPEPSLPSPLELTRRQLQRLETIPEAERGRARARMLDDNFRRFLEEQGVHPGRIRDVMRRPLEERKQIVDRLRRAGRDVMPPLVARLRRLTPEQRQEIQSLPPGERRLSGRAMSRQNLIRSLQQRFQLSETDAERWADLRPEELERRLHAESNRRGDAPMDRRSDREADGSPKREGDRTPVDRKSDRKNG
ncbi:MAG: hypothetical protein RL885_06485 [Planctomycetota bacterium]